MGKMDPKRQKESIKYLIREGMRLEIIENIDTETLLFIDNSKNIDIEIDTTKYKWVASGEGYDDFPLKKWQLKNFFYEIASETEALFLGVQQDMGIERLILSVCKILIFQSPCLVEFQEIVLQFHTQFHKRNSLIAIF